MEVAGKIPPGFGPGGRFAVGIMLANRDRRPTSEVERRRLSAAVTARGWQLSVRFGPATALAELCQVDREEAAREAWGLPRRLDLVLLLSGAVLGDELDEFVRAVRTHAPRTRIYRWTGADIVPLDPCPDEGEAPSATTHAAGGEGDASGAADRPKAASLAPPPSASGRTARPDDDPTARRDPGPQLAAIGAASGVSGRSPAAQTIAASPSPAGGVESP